MEPFAKRHRLYPPLERNFPQNFNHQFAYYADTPDTDLGFDEIDDSIDEEEVEEDDEEVEETDVEPDFDPDTELQQRRARLDYKLKSTFEAIFDKYEKDFDGIGDEIDLATGEILVNNGHLLDMQDERDAGDIGRARHTFRNDTEEIDDTATSFSMDEPDVLGDDYEMNYDDDDDEDEEMLQFLDDGDEPHAGEIDRVMMRVEEPGSDGEMVEDDMILRGFAKANRFMKPSVPLASFGKPTAQANAANRNVPDPPVNSLPSQSDILAQFGPHLGPQIVKYVTTKQAPNDSHIEPAWRAPELPSDTPRPVPRPPKDSFAVQQESQRTPSPEASRSIWAISRSRTRNPVAKHTKHMIVGKQASASHHKNQKSHQDSLSRSLLTVLESRSRPPKEKRVRRNYTEEDEDILLDWIAKARKKGQSLTSGAVWNGLATIYPHHSAQSWQGHYIRKYTYLPSDPTEQDEISTAETSLDAVPRDRPEESVFRPTGTAHHISDPSRLNQPKQIREPFQRDSRIMTWSKDVDYNDTPEQETHFPAPGVARRTKPFNLHPTGESQMSGHTPEVSPSPKISAHRQAGFQSSGQNYVTKGVDTPEAGGQTSDPMDIGPNPIVQEKIPGASCPHVDCKPFPSLRYRLQRRADEEVSEMCVHLFTAHQTTPFPCAEANCERKGSEGYFMQADLVKHVVVAHPGVSALQRLRGRVDAELLDRTAKASKLAEKTPNPTSNRPASQQKDSDFMSPIQTTTTRWDSQPLSSHSDLDQTPRANGLPGRSTFTPMTSVSSLIANHSSDTLSTLVNSPHSAQKSQPVSDSSKPFSASGFTADQPLLFQSPMVEKYTEPINHRSDPDGKPISSALRHISETPENHFPAPQHTQLVPKALDHLEIAHTREVNLTPSKSTGANPGHPQNENGAIVHDPTSQPKSSFPSTIPNSQSSPINLVVSSPVLHKTPQQPKPTRETFTRNTIDPAYEFSDEETYVPPVTKPTFAKPLATKSPVGKSPVTKIMPEKTSRALLTPIPTVLPSGSADTLVANKVIQSTPQISTIVSAAVESTTTVPSLEALSSKPSTSLASSSLPTPRSGQKAPKPLPIPPKVKRVAVKAKPPLTTPAAKAKLPLVTPAAKTRLPLITPGEKPKPPFKTPAAKPKAKKTKKAVIRSILTNEDFDELGLEPDELLLISSIPRGIKISEKIHIKEERSDTPRPASVPTKKRKLDMFQEDDDEDELSVEGLPGILGSGSRSTPKIKDEPISSPASVLQSRKPRVPTKLRHEISIRSKTPTSVPTPQPRSQLSITNSSRFQRTSTPLLDLTPSKTSILPKIEIRDSETDGSSPIQTQSNPRRQTRSRKAAINSSLTPRHNRFVDPLRNEQVDIVVKTPGGSFRRCGEDGFRCGRSFCFRCGPKDGECGLAGG